jgi:multiple sugar transport system ATP-binding protein
MITVRINDALVSIKADKSFRAEIGDMITGAIPADICHLFDAESGERLD